MAELKTKKTEASVADFLNAVTDETKRNDCFKIAEMMKSATKAEPKMWGPAIIGFGSVRLKYDSGRELDWFPIGFSPRKKEISLYIGTGADFENKDALLAKLGKHKLGKGCLYINKLEDVDVKVLKELIKASLKRK